MTRAVRRISTTDARAITVTRAVDELDRVTLVDYPGTDLDVTYTYDAEPVACGGASFAARLLVEGFFNINRCY